MATIIRISPKTKPESIRKALLKLSQSKKNTRKNKLADYYGAGISVYEDGLTYQKKQRDEPD